MPDGAVPEWSTLPLQTEVDPKPEAKDGGLTYTRRKLKMKSPAPYPCKPAEVSKANLGLFVPHVLIPLIKVKKPVWIILERSFDGVPIPWHCNLLAGGTRTCPQRGGVQVIGDGFVVQTGKLTEAKHRMHFDKHLEADYIDGSFYVVLEQIQLHANPISCRGCPTNGRKSIIDMRSFQIDLDGSWAKEK